MRSVQMIVSTPFILLACAYAESATLDVKLNTKIELVPTCVINGQPYMQGATGINLGVLNFGTISANFMVLFAKI